MKLLVILSAVALLLSVVNCGSVNLLVNYSCEKSGRFEDTFTSDCKTYIICMSNKKLGIRMSCADNQVFSPREKRCVNPDQYECPIKNVERKLVGETDVKLSYFQNSNDNRDAVLEMIQINEYAVNETSPEPSEPITELPTSTVTEPSSTLASTTVVSTTPAEYECTQAGRFPRPDCGGYILCILIDNEWFSQKQDCPDGYFFSKKQGYCVPANGYNCVNGELETTTGPPLVTDPIIESTTLPIPTTETTSTTVKPVANCHSPGRIPAPESKDCKSYILCLGQGNGEFIENYVNCPATTIFSAELAKCVPESIYKCENGQAVTTPVPITTLSDEIVTEPKEHECIKQGRFADNTVSGCRGYNLCIATEGDSFIKVQYLCPETTLFSPDSEKCVRASEYECKCAA